ncbi:hypothetical protein [Arenimonas sp.]|uniref:hypothetical protein n=1 Tax=Arenimonas sp. TaxID=1872635 RepID=UPI0039E72A67
MSDLTAVRRVAYWLMPLVGIASLLGGSVFWLRRVGWLQTDEYWFDNAQLAARAPATEDPFGVYWFVMQHHASLHRIEGWWTLTKLAKEFLLLAFLLLALVSILRARPPRAFAWAYAGAFLLGLVSAIASAAGAQWLALVAGARGFASWVIAWGSMAWLDESLLRRLARVCAWTLFAQMPLVAIELMRGMPIYATRFLDHDLVRVVGSFNLPISLGAFAVVAWTTMLCWSGYSRRTLRLATAALMVLLLFNASATAWVAFAAAVVATSLPTLRTRARSLMLALVLPAAIVGWFALPTLTGREDVHDSLWGRITPVQTYAAENLSTRELLFGSGFGLGTNALGRQDDKPDGPVGRMPDRPVGDSMPAAVFWQIGLIGLVLIYSLFALALRADARTRPIGIALLVCSLGVNITELFPVNLILGFWLANAMRGGRDDVAA